ncbi:formylmethanofuran dehydrogenase subunit C [Candidatus Bathyarchaeota archaeon]|nr:formylmethanofuran dehydrogenase subunit C [Candidatus Bathyarchaeota archaeon]
MGLILELKRDLRVPIDMSPVAPDNLDGKPLDEIRGLMLWEGNRRIPLGEVFDMEKVDGGGLTILGDLSKARRLGYMMRSGEIKVRGNAGLYVGEAMRGGMITVEGDAGAWLGSRMAGGEIVVEGDAGDFVGSSYRGSREGMRKGIIKVKGDAGDEVGCWMRGGLIWIEGNVGCFPGIHMIDGTIFIGGDCQGRAGAEMLGGRIIIQGRVSTVLPSFRTSDLKGKVKVDDTPIQGPFYVFEGDLNEDGSGRLYVNKGRNPHLSWCEKLIGEVD